ncbi:hypothetical protein HDK77DRAFT_424468 [Phyllosticta capitalensis]
MPASRMEKAGASKDIVKQWKKAAVAARLPWLRSEPANRAREATLPPYPVQRMTPPKQGAKLVENKGPLTPVKTTGTPKSAEEAASLLKAEPTKRVLASSMRYKRLSLPFSLSNASLPSSPTVNMTSMDDTEQRLQANFAAAQEELRRFQETKEVSKKVAEMTKDVKTEEELERLLPIIADHATAKGLSLEVFEKVAGKHGKPVEGSEPNKQAGAKPGKKGAKLVEDKGPMTPVKKTGTALKSEEKSVKALHLAARQARPPPSQAESLQAPSTKCLPVVARISPKGTRWTKIPLLLGRRGRYVFSLEEEKGKPVRWLHGAHQLRMSTE